MHWFGPPTVKSSTWSWLDHLASGLKPLTESVFLSDSAFTWSPPNGLNFARDFNLLAPYTKGTSLGLCLVNCLLHSQVSVNFRSTFMVFFHLSLSVLVRYSLSDLFRLRGWFPFFPTTLHRGHPTQSFSQLGPRGCYPLWQLFPELLWDC